MRNFLNINNREKHLFKSYYCSDCKQKKPCYILSQEYCCPCQYEIEQVKAKEHSSYQQIYQRKVQERKARVQQLQLLKNYQGCPKCRSLAVDAYSLYQENRLTCQFCLIKKEGGASSPISFIEQQKWFKKQWKIDLVEWLEKYQCLPVNKNCADKWLKNPEHLDNCACLEQEAKELYLLFTNSLQKAKENLKKCKCETSNKPRTPYYDSASYGYTYCETCQKELKGAGKMGVIKNRNDPRFWGLKIKEKVLCLNCLGKFQEKMPKKKKYVFNKYLGRYGE
jgi:hypothetical protein